MPVWLQVVGRFHPLVLHLPIGLLAALAALELAAMVKKPAGPAAVLLSMLAAVSAVVGAATGFVLSYEGGFADQVVWYHQWLGIAVAAGSVVTCVLYVADRAAWRRAALVVTMGLLVPAGHLGATMTHGDDFLFAPLAERSARAGEVPAGGTSIYEVSVAPVFAQYCVSCHGPSKHKGGLALHTPEAVLRGAETGVVVEAGHPDTSELLRRMRLPLDDEDHMPPAKKAQPRQEQIGAIEAWIAAGADVPRRAAAGQDQPAPAAPEASKPAPKGPDPAAVAALRAKLVHVEPVAQGSDLLVIDFAAIATAASDDMVAELLGPLSDHIAELSLARSPTTGRTLDLAAHMTRLRRLDLRGTKVSAAGLDALREHATLEDLVLVQTTVGDDAVERLLAMPGLKRVYLWHAGLTPEGIARLRAKEGLVVDAGDRAETTVAQAETEIKLTSDAPAPGLAAAPALTPVNTVCPVSGSPVDPKYAIVFEGKVIGFCCPNCPKEFWTNPEKFAGKLK